MSRGFTERDGPPAHEPLRMVDPRTLAGLPVPERQWVVEGWLPTGHVTLLYAPGGTGKSLLALQLAVACATGTPWLGLTVKRCRALALWCEDTPDELHRRTERVTAALGLDFGDLADLRWACAVGADNVLLRFGPDGSYDLTPRFHDLVREVRAFGAELLVIDGAADTFAGSENDRAQVRAFLGPVLTRLAQDTGSAVLLLAHPSRSGMSAGGDQDGGSTAWNNTARSRWALTRPEADGDTAPDENLRVLSRRKSNYSGVGDEIELRWGDGVLSSSRQARPSGFRLLGVEATFLNLLDRCTARNVFVSGSRHAGNYAPKLFAKRPDRDGYSRQDFEAALHSLYSANRITNVPYGRVSDARFRIARAEASVASDSEGVPDTVSLAVD